MTQEEFLKEYRGKNIKVVGGFDTGYIRNVQKADFSTGNACYIGYIDGESTIIVNQYSIEKQKEEIILRQEDTIEVLSDSEFINDLTNELKRLIG